MYMYLVPFATIVNGQPYVSFKFIESIVEPKKSVAEPKELVTEPEKSVVEPFFEEPTPFVDDMERYADESLDEYDEIMNRRHEAQENYRNNFYQVDELQREINEQLNAAQLVEMHDESNVHEILMDPIFGNMNNEEKKELKKKAAEEVTRTIDLPQTDPNFDSVFCEKMDQWLIQWANERKNVVEDYMRKFSESRDVEQLKSE